MPSGCLSTDVYLGQGPGGGPGPRCWDYKSWLARKNLQVLQEQPRGFLLRTRSALDAAGPSKPPQYHTISSEWETMQKKNIQSHTIQLLNFYVDDASQDRPFVTDKYIIVWYFSTTALAKPAQTQDSSPQCRVRLYQEFSSPYFLHQGHATCPTRPPRLSSQTVLFSDSPPATINTHFHASQKAVSQPRAFCRDNDFKLHHWLTGHVSFSLFLFLFRREAASSQWSLINQVWFCDQQKTPTVNSHRHIHAVCQLVQPGGPPKLQNYSSPSASHHPSSHFNHGLRQLLLSSLRII